MAIQENDPQLSKMTETAGKIEESMEEAKAIAVVG
jgi:hypothetical protein